MYIPFDWLKKHIIFPTDIQIKEVGRNLTELGLETESNENNWQFTPLPNRLDLFTWWGIAHEVNILLSYPLKLPISNENTVIKTKNNWGRIEVKVDTCSQMSLALIKNVKIQNSPPWVKDYLTSNNINPVNNVVDIANLVMLETGQPLHVYDYNKLPEKEFIVRQVASNKEKIKILSGKEVALDPEDIVISSKDKVIGLAGVIGSQDTMVDNETTNVVLERAFFDSLSMKKTSQRLSLSTTASHYFGKRLNLPFGKFALKRAIELMKEICHIKSKEQIINWPKNIKKETRIISLDHKFIERKLGIKIETARVKQILKQLQFSLKKEKNEFK